MDSILNVSGLNKSYGDFSLRDVTFSPSRRVHYGIYWH